MSDVLSFEDYGQLLGLALNSLIAAVLLGSPGEPAADPVVDNSSHMALC
jgi:hypothetical protein